MKIIIIGCGKVGYALAEELTEEKHEVTIIDSSSERLQEVEEDLDALQILGNGSSLSVLMEADIKNADLFISVTGSDELNLLCCLIARKVGKCQTVARVRNPVYNKELSFIKESLGISMIINPEMAAALEIARLLRFPSAIKIDTFAKGKIELLKFRLKPEFHLDQISIADLPQKVRCDICLLYTSGKEKKNTDHAGTVCHSSGSVCGRRSGDRDKQKYYYGGCAGGLSACLSFIGKRDHDVYAKADGRSSL